MSKEAKGEVKDNRLGAVPQKPQCKLKGAVIGRAGAAGVR